MFRRVGLVYFLPVANVAVTWPPSPFYRHIWEQFHPTMKAKRCLFALKSCGRTKTNLPEQMSGLLDFKILVIFDLESVVTSEKDFRKSKNVKGPRKSSRISQEAHRKRVLKYEAP